MKYVRFYFFVFSLSYSVVALSQTDDSVWEKIDYNEIETTIRDTGRQFYYPRLLERYKANDTTITQTEYRYLYYGYTFQEDYNSVIEPEDSIFARIRTGEQLTKEEYRELLDAAGDFLLKSPFDLRVLFWEMIAHKELGNEPDYLSLSKKVGGLLDAILSSGDGFSVETAFYVARVSDEYFLLNILDIVFDGEQSLVYPCDYLKVRDNEYGVEGLYFNVERHFAFLKKMFEEK